MRVGKRVDELDPVEASHVKKTTKCVRCDAPLMRDVVVSVMSPEWTITARQPEYKNSIGLECDQTAFHKPVASLLPRCSRESNEEIKATSL
jgi:hypothetical protein